MHAKSIYGPAKPIHGPPPPGRVLCHRASWIRLQLRRHPAAQRHRSSIPALLLSRDRRVTFQFSSLLKEMQGNPLEHSPLSKSEIFSMEYPRIGNK